MELSDEEIDRILDECSITYEFFDIIQMMMIKKMLKRISIEDVYGSGNED
jgi:hypothetical protein